MKRFVVLTAVLAVGMLTGCSGSTATTTAKHPTMTEGPFRCTAKDSFGNAWSWTASHKELAMTNAYDMCRYRSTDTASCKVTAKDCTLVSQIPDHLDSLTDFGSGQ